MKNFILSIFILCTVAFATSAQYTQPRFGTAKYADNTARTLTYNKVGYTFVPGPDTLKLTPGAFETIVMPDAAPDSLLVVFSNVKTSYFGDRLTIMFKASGAARKLKFSSTNCKVGTTLTAASDGKYVSIEFIFDGVAWIERCRFTQP